MWIQRNGARTGDGDQEINVKREDWYKEIEREKIERQRKRKRHRDKTGENDFGTKKGFQERHIEISFNIKVHNSDLVVRQFNKLTTFNRADHTSIKATRDKV